MAYASLMQAVQVQEQEQEKEREQGTQIEQQGSSHAVDGCSL